MSQALYVFTLLLFAGTAVAIFGLRYLALSRQTNSRVANESSYLELAARSTAAQSEALGRLNSIHGALSGFGQRLDAIEKILSQVS
jgi:hypothetical protein